MISELIVKLNVKEKEILKKLRKRKTIGKKGTSHQKKKKEKKKHFFFFFWCEEKKEHHTKKRKRNITLKKYKEKEKDGKKRNITPRGRKMQLLHRDEIWEFARRRGTPPEACPRMISSKCLQSGNYTEPSSRTQRSC